jgi:hypothetical protein
MVEALFLHPYQNYTGNILWAVPTNSSDFDKLNISLEDIRKLGYWASAFPEGDGITFNHQKYSKERGISDFRRCFSWLNLTVTSPTELNEKLALLYKDKTTRCKVLVPVSKLWLEDEFAVGDFRFIPPMNDSNITHPWFDLLTNESNSFIPQLDSLGHTKLEVIEFVNHINTLQDFQLATDEIKNEFSH